MKALKNTDTGSRREIITITIDGEQGSGKTTTAQAIKEALDSHRLPYSKDSLFLCAIFDCGRVEGSTPPTADEIKARNAADGSNVFIIVK